MALARELSEPLFVSRDPIRNQDSDATTLQKVFDEHIRALQETLRINSAGAIAAGFITGLLEKWPLEKTLRFASAPWVPPAPAPWVAQRASSGSRKLWPLSTKTSWQSMNFSPLPTR
jgi:hypothetical protein